MRKLLLIALFVSFSSLIFGQQKILFTYDNSGNRIKREIYFPEPTRSARNNPELTAPIVENLDSAQILITPNKGAETISVEFKADNRELVGHYVLFDSSGRLLGRSQSAQSDYLIDISKLPKGIYLLHLVVEGETKIWKLHKE